MKEHKELLLLQIADIRVSSQGKIGTYQDRLKDVADQYGSESPEVSFTNFTKYSIIYIVDNVFNSKVLFLYFFKEIAPFFVA